MGAAIAHSPHSAQRNELIGVKYNTGSSTYRLASFTGADGLTGQMKRREPAGAGRINSYTASTKVKEMGKTI